MKTTLATVFVLTLCASAAAGQGPRVRPVPAAGEMVRVTPPSGEPYIGRVAALGGDTLVLTGDSAVRVVTSEQRVEILRRHRERWSALGALAGIALGVGAKLVSSGSDTPHAVGSTVVTGAAGAFVGGLLGFSVAPQRWQPLRSVPPAPPPLAARAETER